jgi:hypothetical protein
MTLLDIAVHLRQMGAELAHQPNWNPQTDWLVRYEPGATWVSPLCDRVGELLLTAYRSGAFDDSYFNDLRPRLIDSRRGEAATLVIRWLYDKGFPVADSDPQLDPFERLATAFEAIAQSLSHKAKDHKERRIDPTLPHSIGTKSNPACPVQLRGDGEKALVQGHEAEPLYGQDHAIIETLVSAWPKGRTKGQLEKDGFDSPNKRLERIRNRSPLWKNHIHMPGKNGRGGYRII